MDLLFNSVLTDPTFFQHEKQLHALANALLERETLTSDEINKVVHPYQEPQLPFQEEAFALT
jgi:ATP-dependent metalloprotease